MQIVVFLMMILAIFAQVDWRPSAAREARSDLQLNFAHQLVMTHEYSLRVCTRPADKTEPSGDCAAGPSDLNLGMGTPGQRTANHFPTYWDGNALVTTWIPAPGTNNGAGEMASALILANPDSSMVGLYSAVDGTIRNGTHLVGSNIVVVVPPDLRQHLTDGFPVYLTCTRTDCFESK